MFRPASANLRQFTRLSSRGSFLSTNFCTDRQFSSVLVKSRYDNLVRKSSVRFQSSQAVLTSSNAAINSTSSTNNSLAELNDFVVPEPPSIPQPFSELLHTGPYTCADLDITTWLPTGWTYNLLDYVHSCGLPWYATIISATIVGRLIVFPFLVQSQRLASKNKANTQIIKDLQAKLEEAQTTNNPMLLMKMVQEHAQVIQDMDMQKFLKQSKLKSLAFPAVQTLLFTSFFITLRTMGNHPVNSFKDEGMLWFTDLTQCDPYYVLPVFTSISLFAVLKAGMELGQNNFSSPYVKNAVHFGIPMIVGVMSSNFCSGIALYWATSNFISIFQSNLILLPKVRKFLGLPKIVKQVETATANSPKRPVKYVLSDGWNAAKTKWSDFKIKNRMQQTETNDFDVFKKAGTGPLKKTFKINHSNLNNRQVKTQIRN